MEQQVLQVQVRLQVRLVQVVTVKPQVLREHQVIVKQVVPQEHQAQVKLQVLKDLRVNQLKVDKVLLQEHPELRVKTELQV